MSALLLGLLLATQPVTPSTDAAPGVPPTAAAEASAAAAAPELPATTPPPSTTTSSADAATAPAETNTPAPATVATPSMRGPVGVGLLAVGASLAAGGTVAFTFVEAVSTPDRQSNPPSAGIERFTTVSGFLGVAVASVSAVLVVIGAALTLSDSGDGAVPSA